MRPIPKQLRNDIASDPFYAKCARLNDDCDGRITFEHAWIYAGKQINERFAIIPLCWRHHLGDKLNKHENQRISLLRATDEDLAKYPKKDWVAEKRKLGI